MDKSGVVISKLRILVIVAVILSLFASFAAAAEPVSYSLADLLKMAEQSNHNLKAQTKELQAKQAAASGAKGLAGPYIELNGVRQQQGDPTGLIPAHAITIPAKFDDNMISYSITARQVLYDAGKTKSFINVKNDEVDLQKMNVYKEKLRVAGEVTKSFYRILQLNDTIKAQTEIIHTLDAVYMEAKLRVEVGRIAEVDVMQLEAQIAVEKEKLARYQGQLDTQISILNSFLGTELPANFQLTGQLTDYTPAFSSGEASLFSNPELHKSELRQQQASDLLQVAKADKSAHVTLNGEYSQKILGQGISEDLWTIGVIVRLPVFDGGVIAANIRQNKLQAEKAKEEYEQVLADTKTADTIYRSNMTTAGTRAEAALKAWKRAEEVYRILTLSYQAGRSSATEMLVAQSTTANAQAIYYQALYDRIESAVNLAELYGRMPYQISGDFSYMERKGADQHAYKKN